MIYISHLLMRRGEEGDDGEDEDEDGDGEEINYEYPHNRERDMSKRICIKGN